MPRYNVTQVTKALLAWKAQDKTQDEIAAEHGMGLSTLQRHITEYRAGRRPDIDVGEMPPPKSSSGRRRRAPSMHPSGGAPDVGREIDRALSAYAARMLVIEEEAVARHEERERIEREVQKLKKALRTLRPDDAPER